MMEMDRALGLACSTNCNSICPDCFCRFLEAFQLLQNAPKEGRALLVHLSKSYGLAAGAFRILL